MELSDRACPNASDCPSTRQDRPPVCPARACPLRALDFRGFPQHIVQKTRRIVAQLCQGVPYYQLRGKRLKAYKNLIRIPVGRRYRLLCHQRDRRVIPHRLLSHEDYNSIARNTRR